ncbi:MAG: 4-hydroxythreonine-4-phosphate dehydrogenase PdxA [Planctomycetota bacterium]
MRPLRQKRPRLAVSAGDPQGIGPEVTADALGALMASDQEFDVSLFGDRTILERELKRVGVDDGARVTLVDCPFQDAGEPGPSAAGGLAALKALSAAAEMVETHRADALVTAPLAKEAVCVHEPGFVGHTGFLGHRSGVVPLMMLASERLRIALVTDHLPLREVADHVDRPALEFALSRLKSGLQDVFGVARPHIAVLGLNPHAGEGGKLGREECDLIEPWLKEHPGVEGPFAADGFFRPGQFERFDAILAMYHDQGLIPLKALSAGAALNISLGLPYPRTSPDHGTAFLLAGQGRADSSSMFYAMRCALRLGRGETLQ